LPARNDVTGGVQYSGAAAAAVRARDGRDGLHLDRVVAQQRIRGRRNGQQQHDRDQPLIYRTGAVVLRFGTAFDPQTFERVLVEGHES
jgi:hypothetical protein